MYCRRFTVICNFQLRPSHIRIYVKVSHHSQDTTDAIQHIIWTDNGKVKPVEFFGRFPIQPYVYSASIQSPSQMARFSWTPRAVWIKCCSTVKRRCLFEYELLPRCPIHEPELRCPPSPHHATSYIVNDLRTCQSTQAWIYKRSLWIVFWCPCTKLQFYELEPFSNKALMSRLKYSEIAISLFHWCTETLLVRTSF